MCAIMLDTKGPEIRTGMLKDGKDIELVAGQDFTLINDWDYIGDVNMVGQSYADLGKVLKVRAQAPSHRNPDLATQRISQGCLEQPGS